MTEMEKIQNENIDNLPRDITMMEHGNNSGSLEVVRVKTEDPLASEHEQVPLNIEIAEVNTELEELANLAIDRSLMHIKINPIANRILLSAASHKVYTSGKVHSRKRNRKTTITKTKELDIKTDNSYENVWIKEENDSLVESKDLADSVIHQNSALESNSAKGLTKSEDSTDVKNVDILKKLTPEGDVIFNCRFCDFTSKKKYRVKLHENSHHLKTTLYHCRHCDYSNVNHSSVLTHENRKHKPPHFYKCKFCDLVVKQKFQLRRHENAKHLKVKLHKCQLCEFTTWYKSSLSDHKKNQHGRKDSYKCTICDYTTKRRGDLTKHEYKEHKDMEKRPVIQSKYLNTVYKCQFCEYTSRRKNHLHQHENAKHHKSKLYKCPHCEFTSLYKYSLRDHEKSKHDSTSVYKCHFCDYSAKVSLQLRRHIRTKHPKPNS